MKICIDAGHGQIGNPYPNRPGYFEGTQMFKLAGFLAKELQEYGADVVLTRGDVTNNPDLATRGKIASGCDLFLSVHSNASSGSGFTSARGVSVIDSNRKPNKALADKIGQTVATVMGNNFRGTSYRDYQSGNSFKSAQPALLDYYGVIRSAVATTCKSAIIVEHGFHTNEADSTFLINDENLKRIAKAEADLLAQEYGLKKAEKTTQNQTVTQKTYTVQKGDNLSKIGAKLGLDWHDIAAVNGITAPYTIYVGQVLQLSGGAKYREYTVKSGDSPWKIADKMLGSGKRYVEIEKLNGFPHDGKYVLRVGQIIKIPIS